MQRASNVGGGRNADPYLGDSDTPYFQEDKRPIILFDGKGRRKLYAVVQMLGLSGDPRLHRTF